MGYIVLHSSGQSDFTDAESEQIGRFPTIQAARRAIRVELGVTSLRPERAWHNPADDVIEGWVEDLTDPECDSGYFIIEG